MTAWSIVLLFVFVLALAGAAAYYIHRSRILRKALAHAEERQLEISSFLTRFSTGMRGPDGVSGAMQAAALHVSEQTDAESVAIYSVQNGKLVISGSCGVYPLLGGAGQMPFSPRHHLEDLLRREELAIGDGFIGEIAQKQRPELVRDISADERFSRYPMRESVWSVMAIPLVRDGALTGVVCAVNDRETPMKPFSGEQFEHLQSMADQIIMVQNLVSAYSEISRRERIDQELDFARHLQLSLLPEDFPEWSPFSISAFSRSAKEVNGDFYDFVKIDDDRMLIVMGDACGKGIPACLLTAMTRSFVRCVADNYTSLSDLLKEINRKLHRGSAEDRFITLGCCVLDRKNRLLEFGRAGHTDLVSFVHGHIRVFSPDGTALGILPDDFAFFDTICISFEPGSTFMLYSDGLSEAINQKKEEFGSDRLVEAFRTACAKNIPAQEVIDEIMHGIEAFQAEQNDDQTVILIRHDGSKR